MSYAPCTAVFSSFNSCDKVCKSILITSAFQKIIHLCLLMSFWWEGSQQRVFQRVSTTLPVREDLLQFLFMNSTIPLFSCFCFFFSSHHLKLWACLIYCLLSCYFGSLSALQLLRIHLLNEYLWVELFFDRCSSSLCGTTFCFLNIICARALTCKINRIAYPQPHSLEVFPSIPLPSPSLKS